MKIYKELKSDVVVIGAGHAGIEAGLAAARLGVSVCVLTLSLDCIGNMPCNPCIGGTAKGQLVFELDALGGEMGKAADATMLQGRMLNRSKGPAVQSLRVQSDRAAYRAYMKRALEEQEGLDLLQDEAVEITTDGNRVRSVITSLGFEIFCSAVIVATGTYLGGRIFVGEATRENGPDGISAASRLTKSLVSLGVPIRRFKTGTPARVHRRSIDFSGLEVQPGDPSPVPFHFGDDPKKLNNTGICWIDYTNEKTHEIIRRNISRSPLYSGEIVGIGPRYCPSIEDKVMRFPDRKRHQFFIEPCGENTEEMYLQGLSSSLPLDVQYEMYRSIKGLENVKIMRPAYAIEYDCCDPLWLDQTLCSKEIEGLYGAGQFCGTSGYEEAAVQGLMAGINAARRIKGLDPVILSRSSSYIGTLIDDLVTKGVKDPYRMMTARSEYRLLLRQDNADRRLCETGYRIGLLPEGRYREYLAGKEAFEAEYRRMNTEKIKPSPELNAVLSEKGSPKLTRSATVADLIKWPRIGYDDIKEFDSGRPRDETVSYKAAVEIKYAGYIARLDSQIEKAKRLEQMLIPEDIDYSAVTGLRTEAVEKLSAVRPRSIGQAGRISGVNPTDVNVLAIWIFRDRRNRDGGNG
ncbi:MAG: tRNA uridine-5-carboxymethylaminomethyl(34) synthesis enzyme MnmG [Oscillospiraceae bacterium]|jgi:tRNA uridine 5-carboxymethylaminomethyl modification enzyme